MVEAKTIVQTDPVVHTHAVVVEGHAGVDVIIVTYAVRTVFFKLVGTDS